MLDNIFVLTLIPRYLEHILKQRHILGAFYLTYFKYVYFNSASWALMKKFKGMLYAHWSMGTQYPIEFFLKDMIFFTPLYMFLYGSFTSFIC